MITASPLGEEEAVPWARSEGGSSAPLEATRGRESGGRSGPSSAGYRVHQHEVERCESLSVSDVWNAATSTLSQRSARSGKEQLPARSE